MSEKKKIIREALERAGSLENLFEEIASSESEELQQRQREIEAGPDHPDQDLLRKYALGKVSKEQDHELTEHLMLCGKCAKTVFDIQYLEPIRSELSWERIFHEFKNLFSKISLSMPTEFPVLQDAVARGHESERKLGFHFPGDPLLFSPEAPADGYMAVFYGCEETGEIKVIFPEAHEDPRVSAGQQIGPIADEVEGPGGKHFLKAFWTRLPLFNPEGMDLQDRSLLHEALAQFLDAIEESDSEDWRAALKEFDVVKK